MKMLIVAAVAVLMAVPAVGRCADVYVADRAPMQSIEPGKVYEFNWKKEDLPKDAVVYRGGEVFTYNAIIGIVNDMERAMNRQDAKGAMKYFSPSAVIYIISIAPDGGEAELELLRDEYVKYMQQAWKQSSSYSFRVEETGVVMGADGKSAMLKARMSEEVVIEGRRIKGRAVGIADVRNFGNGPMISRLVIRGIAD